MEQHTVDILVFIGASSIIYGLILYGSMLYKRRGGHRYFLVYLGSKKLPDGTTRTSYHNSETVTSKAINDFHHVVELEQRIGEIEKMDDVTIISWREM